MKAGNCLNQLKIVSPFDLNKICHDARCLRQLPCRFMSEKNKQNYERLRFKKIIFSRDGNMYALPVNVPVIHKSF